MEANRNLTIDVAKLVAAFLVVGIHTDLFGDCNEQLQFLFTGLLCRMGVPFFAICSGYYLAEKESLMPQWKKLVKLYLIWSIIYLVWLQYNWIDTGYVSLNAYIGYCKSMLLSGSYFHLWYVLYVIYALPVYWLVKKYVPIKSWMPLIVLLYGFAALQYGYQKWLPDEVNAAMSSVNGFYALTSAQFVLLPMLLTGGYLKRKGIPRQGRSITLFLLSAALLVTEGEILFAHGMRLVSYVLMILPTAATIFCVLQNMTLHSFPLKQCGELSLLVYCIHPILCYYINPLVNQTFGAWIIVFVFSLLLATAWLKVSKIIIHDRN